MGTRSIAERAAVAVVQMDGPGMPTAAPAPALRSSSGVASALAGIATYIPSEGIGFYIAAFALLDLADNHQDQKWLLLGLTLMLNAYFAIVQILAVRGEREVEASSRHKRRQVVTAVLLTTVALCVYIAALPDNPFLGATDITLPWAGVMAIALALILPSLTKFLGLGPRQQ